MAVILVFGVGGMAFHMGESTVEGIGLAGIVGVVLDLLLPGGRGADAANA